MSTTLTQAAPQNIRPGIQPGKKYRFVVASAEEAVLTIRKRLGESARVVSVKQIEGKGLARFLASPKLEVVAVVPVEETRTFAIEEGSPAEPTLEENPKTNPPFPKTPPPPPKEVNFAVSDEALAARQEKVDTSAAPASPKAGAAPETGVVQKKPTEAPKEVATDGVDASAASAEPGSPPGTPDAEAPKAKKLPQRPDQLSPLRAILKRAHFEDGFILQLEQGAEWERLEAMPPKVALAEVGQILRQQIAKQPERTLPRRLAFLGTPGVGKTTALCKRLARDIFIEQRKVQVLKLEGELPNPDEALATFCEVMGVDLLREPVLPDEIDPEGILYADVPGLAIADREEAASLRAKLDHLGFDGRALVLNAAYDSEVLKDSLSLGLQLGATHLVLTHLDAVVRVARLWPILIHNDLTPAFGSFGQNVTADFCDDLPDYLIERTFPRYLLT